MFNLQSNPFKHALFIWILLLATFVPAFNILGYHVYQVEILLLILSFAILSLIWSMVFSPHALINRLLFALCIYIILDSYILNRMSPSISIALATVILLITKAHHFETITRFIFTFCLFWLISINVISDINETEFLIHPAKQELNTKKLRPIVHIILDEQTSPYVMAHTIPHHHPAKMMLDEFKTRGFRVYQNVWSNSSKTYKSLTDLFGLGLDSNVKKNNIHHKFNYSIKNNLFIQRLTQQNYSITVLQSDYLQLCNHAQFVKCYTYPSTYNGYAMSYFDFNFSSNLYLVFHQLHRLFSNSGNEIFGYKYLILGLKKIHLLHPTEQHFQSRHQLSLHLIEQSQQSISNIQAGQALILHLLTPHFPYVLTQDCQIKDYQEWALPNRYLARQISQAYIYQAYWDQSLCIHNRLLKLVDQLIELDSQPIIFIHGDHGSRISGETTSGETSDMLTTYFAILDRDVDSAYINKRYQLQGLFKQEVRRINFVAH